MRTFVAKITACSHFGREKIIKGGQSGSYFKKNKYLNNGFSNPKIINYDISIID